MILSWNRGAERLFGFTPAEAVGKPVTIIIPLDRLDEEPAILEKIHRGERTNTSRLYGSVRTEAFSISRSPFRRSATHAERLSAPRKSRATSANLGRPAIDSTCC